MATDYFTRDEFREVGGDLGPKVDYKNDDIDRAQAEVIERLESWAGTAWPNVGVALGTGAMTSGSATLTLATGSFLAGRDEGREILVPGAGAAGATLSTSIASISSTLIATLAAAASTTVAAAAVRWGDGDGTAEVARSATEVFDGNRRRLILGHIPVIAISAFTREGEAIDAATYDLYPEIGVIEFDTAPLVGKRIFSVTYTYGFNSCPWAIKRPCILAAKSQMAREEGRSKIPPGTIRYSTETATIELEAQDDGSKPRRRRPWPWDSEASAAVRAFWDPSRPRPVAWV